MSFEAIYRRYHEDLYRYCLTIVGNREDAQDALQNTMVKAMRALQGEKRQIKLKPWLYRIAHNESIDLLRKRRITEEIDVEVTAAGSGAAEIAETRESLRRLIADLEELPDRQRGALVMRELAGLSFEQIGTAFDTSPAVARQTVYEARIGLREMSEGRDMRCDDVCRALSDGDGRAMRRRDIRAHLRACSSCREFRDGIAGRQRDFAALAPLPAVASAGLLRGILAGGGSGSGAAGAGLAGSVGAGAGKAVATSAIVKSAATVAVVAAVGVGAADRSGLVDFPAPVGGDGQATGAQPAFEAKPAALHAAEQGLRGRAAEATRGDRGQAKNLTQPGDTPGPGAPKVEATTGTRAHGSRNGLPAASNQGQQTAAAHRSTRGGKSAKHAQARGPRHRALPPRSNSRAHGPRPHPSPPPVKVKPDKPAPPSFQAPEPADQGAPRAAAQTSKEAR